MMYFFEGVTFGLGFAAAVLGVYMLVVLLDKPKVKRANVKVSNVRTGKLE